MAMEDELDRLKRRLRWEGAGPLTDLSNHTASVMFTRLRAAAQWVSERGEDRPLMTFLLAFLLGFVAGHWGPRRAQR
jgi:hypothetical protein